MERLSRGFVTWVNPFNRSLQFISFERAKVFVFWSKNPLPLIRYLPELDDRRLTYYFHYTLNDYERERLEPGVPPIEERIATFKLLSSKLGKHRVIWRFDPLMLTDDLSPEQLVAKVKRIGDEVAPYTEKLVFSFADIEPYRKVQNNLRRTGTEYREFSPALMTDIAGKIANLGRLWGIKVSTCAESIDLAALGIEHNRCIDDALILRLAGNDPVIRHLYGDDGEVQSEFLALEANPGSRNKDPGQREACGCVFSKDIGQYNTCPHLCLYCYANTSAAAVRGNFAAATRETLRAYCEGKMGKPSAYGRHRTSSPSAKLPRGAGGWRGFTA